MIAQYILTTALALAVLYTWMQSGISRGMRVFLYAVIAAGMYFVWNPNESTHLANILGIGRGADLVLYLWIVLSFLVILNVHLKLRQNLAILTKIVRQLALLEASAGGGSGADVKKTDSRSPLLIGDGDDQANGSDKPA